MHDDISQAMFTIKPRFVTADCKFSCGQIHKGAKMKRITILKTI